MPPVAAAGGTARRTVFPARTRRARRLGRIGAVMTATPDDVTRKEKTGPAAEAEAEEELVRGAGEQGRSPTGAVLAGPHARRSALGAWRGLSPAESGPAHNR